MIYRPVANGGDWWLETHYYVSVSMPGQYCDWLSCANNFEGLAWWVTWAANNVVVDWDPKDVKPFSSCQSIGWSVSAHGVGINGSWDPCPNTAGLYKLSSLSSGTGWWGKDQSANYHSAEGAQVVHSPSNANFSYSSKYLIWYCNGMWPLC